MSAKSKGTTSSSATSSSVSSPAEGLPAASKAKVKEQIKIIVDDLELVLGDLKDVAKELKEVVDQIDTLTSDLQLEDEMTDSSKTDTLNSSSSSTTASSLEKVKVRANAPLIKPPAHPSAILTVLRKPNPPPPPPRLTPVRCEDPHRPVIPANPVKTNGTLLRNGGLPGGPNKIPNGDICCIPNSNLDKVPMQPLMHRSEKDRCPQPGTRERTCNCASTNCTKTPEDHLEEIDHYNSVMYPTWKTLLFFSLSQIYYTLSSMKWHKNHMLLRARRNVNLWRDTVETFVPSSRGSAGMEGTECAAFGHGASRFREGEGQMVHEMAPLAAAASYISRKCGDMTAG
ncbi:Hypothetical predicted protein [Podarcis lilfordi]|uniref:Proline rich 16 n=1 Tax=Podarcis lilfordi TaxID=74358 RepID=A0AA35KZF1_9SAUR|nr:Hypothetical predicted protein [Podarcis lilfordi]